MIIMQKIDEDYITNRVINYMENKVNGNWHAEKTVKADLHQHGVDIKPNNMCKEKVNIFL